MHSKGTARVQHQNIHMRPIIPRIGGQRRRRWAAAAGESGASVAGANMQSSALSCSKVTTPAFCTNASSDCTLHE